MGRAGDKSPPQREEQAFLIHSFAPQTSSERFSCLCRNPGHTERGAEPASPCPYRAPFCRSEL